MRSLRRWTVEWLPVGILGWLVVSCAVAWLAGGAIARANDTLRPISADDFDQRDALWLARALVGEGGWTSTIDHDAIAWVLLRRWQDARTRNRNATFARVAMQYCASLKVGRRMGWLRTLDRAGTQPIAWPHGTRWAMYRPRWMAVLERVDAWAAGMVADPSEGRAVHFGSPTDPAPLGHVVLQLATRNLFYARAR